MRTILNVATFAAMIAALAVETAIQAATGRRDPFPID